jgi:RNA polymerase sigma factor (sigma-70 family)
MNRRRVLAHAEVSLDEINEENEHVPVARAADTRPNPEQVFRQIEASNLVQKAMNQLSPSLRSAINLRDIQRVSVKEAAKLEGVTAGVIKARSLRARRRLAALVNATHLRL